MGLFRLIVSSNLTRSGLCPLRARNWQINGNGSIPSFGSRSLRIDLPCMKKNEGTVPWGLWRVPSGYGPSLFFCRSFIAAPAGLYPAGDDSPPQFGPINPSHSQACLSLRVRASASNAAPEGPRLRPLPFDPAVLPFASMHAGRDVARGGQQSCPKASGRTRPALLPADAGFPTALGAAGLHHE